MPDMTVKQLVKKLEAIFASLTEGNYPHEWDENFISYSLMKELRSVLKQRRVKFRDFTKTIDCRSYKNKGVIESTHGDIALLVHIQFSTGHILQGVAFLEAKREYESGKFDSIDFDQLARIHSNTPHSQLLLYLHHSARRPCIFPEGGYWQSHIWTSPLNTVNFLLPQLSTAQRKLAMLVTFPFTLFLTTRILWGHDLDHRQDVYQKTIVGLGIDDRPPPAYLGILNIYYNGQSPVEIIVGENWEAI